MKKTKSKFFKILPFVCCASMIAAVAGGSFGGIMGKLTVQADDGTNYEFEAKNSQEAEQNITELNLEIARESVVLLKNEDNALPIASTSKVTLFGNGQNKTAVGSEKSFSSVLSGAGLELNPTVLDFYNNSAPSRDYSPANGHLISGYAMYEANPSTFTFTPENANFTEYDDAAFVVFSRIGGEGFDLPTRMAYNAEGGWGGYNRWDSQTAAPGARSVDDHYLQLDQNETELLDYVCEHFEKVIVLINSGCAMELGFLDDEGHYAYHPEIKAALLVNRLVQGMDALGEIITGKVNPSGRLVDTWSRDFTKDPSYMNFSRNLQTDGNRYVYGSGTASGSYFVYYEEGIYVGYRYYETRGEVEGLETPYNSTEEQIKGTTTTNWNNWYDAHVVYPYGYGLSYTNFEWELVTQDPAESATLTKDGTISATVKVTNKGSVAGKDVVQMYYTAPYTEGGIEKAHVVMSGFQKTGLIEPGASENVTVTMKVEDMKSYDYSDANENNIKGYELEKGNYQIKLMRDAHNEATNQPITLNYSVAEDIYYDTDSVTGNKVENRFDDVSFNENGVKTYLSRADFEGTFPTSGALKKSVSKTFVDSLGMPTVNEEYDADKPWHSDEHPTFAEEGDEAEIMLNYLIGRDYDDPLWDKFMDQLTREETYSLPGNGFYRTVGIERVNKPFTYDTDGPLGWALVPSLYSDCPETVTGYYLSTVCGTVLSQTFNPDLAYRLGVAMAEAGYLATGRISGWYAPSMNIHRSPFGGRNYEYFSEDGYLSGVFAAAEISGAASKGMYAYAKHMFLNEQETNRVDIATWANEQAMREIYAKPFELSVKEGHVHAVMSSFNRIGATPARQSYATLTQLLRDEWGFEGFVVTDYADGSNLTESDLMARAGNDLRLGRGGPTNTDAANTATHEQAIRKAAKNILFTVANSNAMNGVGTDWGNPVKPVALEYADRRVTMTKDVSVPADTTVATAVAPGKTDGIKYEVVGGSLPQGVTLNEDGTFSGTPTGASGLYKVQVKASDTTTKYAYTFADATATISIVLQNEGENLAVKYENGTLANGVVGTEYSASVATASVQSAFDEKIIYTLKEGSTLPAGLSMNSSGQITGRPTEAVSGHKFTVIASVANSEDWIPTEAEFTLTIQGRLFLNKRTINIYKQTDFERTLDLYRADGGNASVTFALKTGELPAGVQLDAATGKLSGKIDAAGTYTFTVTVTADGYTTGEAEITIVVHEFRYVD